MAGHLDLLDTEEAALVLRISARTLRRWRDEGTGPKFVRYGRAIRYTRGDLERFVSQSRTSA